MVITGRAHCFNDSMYLYAHLGSVRFEHSECRGLLMTTYITLIALLVEHSLVHWYQQCVTVRHVPKCMSFPKAIVVITGRAHCFYDCMYILRPSCFCEIWALMSWITYEHVYIYIYIYEHIYFWVFHTCFENGHEITDSGLKLFIHWR